MTPLRPGQPDSTLAILDGLRARNEALEAVLRQAREALRAFRAYYIHDHRLGLDPGSNSEILRADEVLAAIDAALEE